MQSETTTMIPPSLVIQAQNVRFSYGSHPLFKGLSFTLPAGSITGLLGKNGEGKTTLLKLLSGLLLAKGGSLTVLGHSSRERSVPLLQEVYYLPEEVQLPATSATQYLDGAGQFYPNYDATLARQLLKDFDVPPTNNLRRLSMGQKKKVALVLALSLRVPLLLLDEPTNGLDIPSKSKFRQLLVQHISDEQTVLISTHQVRDLEQMIDRLSCYTKTRSSATRQLLVSRAPSIAASPARLLREHRSIASPPYGVRSWWRHALRRQPRREASRWSSSSTL